MSGLQVFEVFFTGKDDPRDGSIVIGEDTKPIFFRFETPDSFTMGDTRTTVYRNAGEVVAWLDWSAGHHHLGLVTIANRQSVPMNHFIMHGSAPSSRVFLSADGRQFEWRKCEDDPHSYDATPVGPSYAFMSYLFDNDLLLLEALVALCINRWIDWRGM